MVLHGAVHLSYLPNDNWKRIEAQLTTFYTPDWWLMMLRCVRCPARVWVWFQTVRVTGLESGSEVWMGCDLSVSVWFSKFTEPDVLVKHMMICCCRISEWQTRYRKSPSPTNANRSRVNWAEFFFIGHIFLYMWPTLCFLQYPFCASTLMVGWHGRHLVCEKPWSMNPHRFSFSGPGLMWGNTGKIGWLNEDWKHCICIVFRALREMQCTFFLWCVFSLF